MRTNAVIVVGLLLSLAGVSLAPAQPQAPASRPATVDDAWATTVRRVSHALVSVEARERSSAWFVADAQIGPFAGGGDADVAAVFLRHAVLSSRAYLDDGVTPIAATVADDVRLAATDLADTPSLAVPDDLVAALRVGEDPVAAELIASRWLDRALGELSHDTFGLVVLWKPCPDDCGHRGSCDGPMDRLSFVVLGRSPANGRVKLLRWATAAELLAGDALPLR